MSSWTRFSVPFTYFNATTPAYILMVLTSGDSLVTVLNSQSWYDDIALIYNLTASPSIPSATVNGTDGALQCELRDGAGCLRAALCSPFS
ncbi:MAG: hypothetical protein IPI07_10970 [Flavobacteriales bacterium]|nr:hypothetical protein [Flavobacteriales bacterium]